MKTVGIIAEYNPFHNGHAYQIAQAKELTGAGSCIVIMSGNFVQRGIPAMMDKFLRTRAALMCGADLVIELPIHYATANAECFASGAIALLDRLDVADYLCFGSECGNLHTLMALSDALLTESAEFKVHLKSRLKAGYPYPLARNEALRAVSPQLTKELSILQYPNNILGLEYLKALKRRNSRIKPYTISRRGADYHDANLQHTYSSALALRESITLRNDIRYIKEQVPSAVYGLMEESYQKFFPILPDDIGSLLPYKLILEQDGGFTEYFDIDKSLSDKIRKCLPSYTDFASFCMALKSKNMTYARVSRSLLHILLNIYQADVDAFCLEDYVYYARILGFKKEAASLLSAIKAASAIPLISKLADATQIVCSENGRKMLAQDIQANTIYDLMVHQKFRRGLQSEYQKQIIIL